MKKPVRVETSFILLILFISLIVVYWPVHEYPFISYDDETLISHQTPVSKGLTRDGIAWAFTSLYGANWHPLTWLSLMLDAHVYGLHAGGFHLTNLFLHIANTLMLFFLLRKMTAAVWGSFFVAFLFGLHPLHVESVVWVAERKDVLSAFFWIATLWMYLRYVESPGWIRYVVVIFTYLLGLMSKPMLVTLPFVMILLDYWPLARYPGCHQYSKHYFPAKRLSFLLFEKIPLMLMAAMVSFFTIIAQQQAGALKSLQHLSIDARLSTAIVAYFEYIKKIFFPGEMVIFYPHPGTWPTNEVVLKGLVLIALSMVILKVSYKRAYLKTGWLWFLGTLIPVIGLVQVGNQFIADRYTYLPSIGIFIISVWGLSEFYWFVKILMIRLSSESDNKFWIIKYRLVEIWRATALVSIIAILLLSTIWAWKQVRYWENPLSVLHHTVEATKNNYEMMNNYGVLLLKEGRTLEAINYFKRSMEIKPDFLYAQANLGQALLVIGDAATAIDCLEDVLKKNPLLIRARRDLADAMLIKGDAQGAIPHYRILLSKYPDDAAVHNNIGHALVLTGNKHDGIMHFEKALSIDPNYETARKNLKTALGK